MRPRQRRSARLRGDQTTFLGQGAASWRHSPGALDKLWNGVHQIKFVRHRAQRPPNLMTPGGSVRGIVCFGPPSDVGNRPVRQSVRTRAASVLRPAVSAPGFGFRPSFSAATIRMPLPSGRKRRTTQVAVVPRRIRTPTSSSWSRRPRFRRSPPNRRPQRSKLMTPPRPIDAAVDGYIAC